MLIHHATYYLIAVQRLGVRSWRLHLIVVWGTESQIGRVVANLHLTDKAMPAEQMASNRRAWGLD